MTERTEKGVLGRFHVLEEIREMDNPSEIRFAEFNTTLEGEGVGHVESVDCKKQERGRVGEG